MFFSFISQLQIAVYLRIMSHFESISFYFRVVPIGEASVIIAVSSAHRKNSLEAVQYCIDTLKATVPIWKKVLHSYFNPWGWGWGGAKLS